MKKIAVFGKPGGGKSTLSKNLAKATGIALHPLDSIEYTENGERVPLSEYTNAHEFLINSDSWIIDGLGSLDSFWRRIGAADTIVYIDLPYWVHYWWVTKRLIKGVIVKPEGWPDGSSVLHGTLASWKYLRLSPKFWTPELYKKLQESSTNKTLYRINTVSELNAFIKQQVS
ncbi:MAG: adenylate kinase [Agarilytica sp.]